MTTKLIVAAGFLVAFAAGLVTGLQRQDEVVPQKAATTQRTSSGPTTARAMRQTNTNYWAWQLNLTPDQMKQFGKIWSDVASRTGREMDDERQKAKQDRDDKILALARAEAKEQVQQVIDDFSAFVDKMNTDRQNAYDSAVSQTKLILTPEQSVKWDEIMTRLQSGRNGRGSGPGWDGPRGGGRNGRGPMRGPGGSSEQRRGEGRPGNSATTRPAPEKMAG